MIKGYRHILIAMRWDWIRQRRHHIVTATAVVTLLSLFVLVNLPEDHREALLITFLFNEPAGLGTMGLNCCILTPEFGPRVYVSALITDAALPAGSPMEKELCTRCGLCVENCPIGAIDGEGWKNPWACASYGCCGTCMAICPVGEI